MAKTLKSKYVLDSAHKQNHGTIVKHSFQDGQYRKRMHEQGYTQTDVEDFDRKALEERITSLLPKKGVTTVNSTRSCNTGDSHHNLPRVMSQHTQPEHKQEHQLRATCCRDTNESRIFLIFELTIEE